MFIDEALVRAVSVDSLNQDRRQFLEYTLVLGSASLLTMKPLEALADEGLPDERMTIYEGSALVGVKSPYLSPATKEAVRTAVQYAQQGKRDETYQAVESLVARLPGVTFGSVAEAVIEQQTNYSNLFDQLLRAKTPVEEAQRKEAHRVQFEKGLHEFKENFSLMGLYFADTGFFGFVFQDGYALMLQLAEPGAEKDKTIPFFRKRETGNWFGVDYIKPHSHFLGTANPGPLGQQFCDYLAKKL